MVVGYLLEETFRNWNRISRIIWIKETDIEKKLGICNYFIAELISYWVRQILQVWNLTETKIATFCCFISMCHLLSATNTILQGTIPTPITRALDWVVQQLFP